MRGFEEDVYKRVTHISGEGVSSEGGVMGEG